MQKRYIKSKTLSLFFLLFLISVPLSHAQTLETTQISTGDQPFAVAVNPNTNKIYVANAGAAADSVTVIDGTTNTVSTTVSVGNSATGVAVNPNTNKIYVANEDDDTVSVIDGSTDTVSTTITVGNAPRGIAVNTETNKIYVANRSANTVSVIDGSTDTVSTTITVGSTPESVAINTSTNKIYVANLSSNNVSVIDGSSDSVSATVTVGTQPRGITANSSTNKIYVSNTGADTVSVINGSTDTVSTTITVGDAPRSLGVLPSTNNVYVPNFTDGTVSVINGSTDTVSKTIAVDTQITAIGVNTSTDKIYVVSQANDRISIISDPRPPEPVIPSGSKTCSDCKPPSFTKQFSDDEFPLSINNENFTLPLYSNHINTTKIQTGNPTELKLLLYENRGPANIPHVALYTDFEDKELNPEFSNTNIVWNNGMITSHDPNQNMLNYTVDVQEKNDKLEVTFEIIFAKPIGKHDILIRTWDSKRNSLDSKIYDAWEIVGEEVKEKQETIQFLMVEPEEIESFVENKEKSLILDKWAGYYAETALDEEVLDALGMQGSNIPHWVKKLFGENIHNGKLEIEDLKIALDYLIEIKVIT